MSQAGYVYADNGLSMSQASMVTSIDDVEEVNWRNQQPAADGTLAQVDMDSETDDSFAIPSTDGRGEALEALNSQCPWITTPILLLMMKMLAGPNTILIQSRAPLVFILV